MSRAAALAMGLSMLLPTAALFAALPAAAANYADFDATNTTAPTVFSDPSAHLSGNLTVHANATLVLSGSTVYLEGDGRMVTLEAGATLILEGNSALDDSPSDNDTGGPGDTAYSIVLGAGSRLIARPGSSINHALGIQAFDAAVEFTSALLGGDRGSLQLNGASSLTATNTSFAQSPGFLIDARGTSRATVMGLGLPPYAAAPGAVFSYSSFAAVAVRDATGKPLGGADWSFETGQGVVAGSSALGGTAATTALDHEGFPVPLFAAVPYLVDTGGVRTYPGVVARAKYAEWTDAKVLNASSDQVVGFVAQNRGVALRDASEMAMLQDMGMEGMMMDNMSMGNTSMDNMSMHNTSMGGMGGMGGMGSMGMMNMTGPMMTQGPGSAWGDFNGDGIVDVVLTSAPETDDMTLMDTHMNATDYPAPALFLGMGDGMFMEEHMSGLESATGANGVSAGDFDGDGHLDLFVSRYGAGGMVEDMGGGVKMFMDGMPLGGRLFHNDGMGMFMDMTEAAGLSTRPSYTVGGVWGDYNRDGCLDLYVVNMGELVMMMHTDANGSMVMPMGMDESYVKPQPNVLYKNNCNGTFTDVTAAAGNPDGGGDGVTAFEGLVMDPAMMYWYANKTAMSPSGSGISYTAAWVDVNEDGLPDLLVADDFGVSPLYKNNGDGTFTLWTAQAGLDKVGSAMGFAIADFNRDGHLDIFQSNFNEDYLWMSNGDGTFTDRAAAWGVADMSVGWGVAAPDLNNDGYPDLAVATGYMSMMMKASERSVLFVNDGGKRFWDASAPSGFDDPALGISLATADVNADGRLDLFLGNTNASNRLFLNGEMGGNEIRLDLHGVTSNAFGVGAEVTAQIGGKPFRTVAQPGGEYASSNEPGVFIGLGGATSARQVTVYWPSGIVQSLGEVKAGSRLTVLEATGPVVDAGPDGDSSTSAPIMLTGSIALAGAMPGAMVDGASYTWIFHGPAGDSTLRGKVVAFQPDAPGVYAAEFIVMDRFGGVLGSDFCIMTVKDTTPPKVSVDIPKTISASGKATFDASNTTDNDPAFRTGGKYEWTFKTAGLDPITMPGVKPTVALPKPGVWNVTLKVTDPSGNNFTRSFDVKVTGFAPATVTSDMVLLAMFATTASIVGIAAVSSRIWRRSDAEGLAPEHFAALTPEDLAVLPAAAVADAPPFPYRPGREEE